MLAAPAVRMRSTGSDPRTNVDIAATTAPTSSSTYSMATISEPSPWIFARTLDSNRSRAIPLIDSLTMTPTRRGSNAATQTSGRRPECANRMPCRHDRLLDEVRRDLHAPDKLAGRDDLPVEDREHLQGVDPVEPLEVRDTDVHDPANRGHEVDPALRRPARRQTRSADRGGETDRRLVLVELAPLGDQNGQRLARVRRADCGEVFIRKPAALRPALAADGDVAGEDGARRAGPAVAGPE